MFEIKLKIEAPDLVAAATLLSGALGRLHAEEAKQAQEATQDLLLMKQTAETAQEAVREPEPAPAAETKEAAPAYTLEQVSRAGAALISSNPDAMPKLLALLKDNGVQSIAELPGDKIPVFAEALQALGAEL